jgi:hypothetical protein
MRSFSDDHAKGRVALKLMFKATECKGMGMNYMAQDRDQWRALLNTVMKTCVL